MIFTAHIYFNSQGQEAEESTARFPDVPDSVGEEEIEALVLDRTPRGRQLLAPEAILRRPVGPGLAGEESGPDQFDPNS